MLRLPSLLMAIAVFLGRRYHHVYPTEIAVAAVSEWLGMLGPKVEPCRWSNRHRTASIAWGSTSPSMSRASSLGGTIEERILKLQVCDCSMC